LTFFQVAVVFLMADGNMDLEIYMIYPLEITLLSYRLIKNIWSGLKALDHAPINLFHLNSFPKLIESNKSWSNMSDQIACWYMSVMMNVWSLKFNLIFPKKQNGWEVVINPPWWSIYINYPIPWIKTSTLKIHVQPPKHYYTVQICLSS
jgi:hypothetical protein